MSSKPEGRNEGRLTVWEWLVSRRALIMGIAVVFTFFIGVVGWRQTSQSLAWDDVIYQTLALFVIGFPAGTSPSVLLNAARYLAAVIVYSAVTAVVVQAVRRSRLLRRAAHFRGHVVVVGEGPEAARLAHGYRASGRKVATIGELTAGETSQLSRRGIVHLSTVADGDFDRILRGATDVIVVGRTDDATVSLGGRVAATVKEATRTTLLLDAPELVADLNARSSMRALCRTSLIAIAALRVLPPFLEDAMVPAPLVVGDGAVAAEIARGILLGWQEMGERRVVHCVGSDDAWCTSAKIGLEAVGELTWTTVTSTRQVPALARRVRGGWTPPPSKFASKGETVYVAYDDNGRTITMASAIASALPDARVLALVDDEKPWGDVANAARVQLESRLDLLADPSTIDLDQATLLAGELVADAARWPGVEPQVLGQVETPSAGPARLDDQPPEVRAAAVSLATATPSLLRDAGCVEGQGELTLATPDELRDLARRIAGTVARSGISPSHGDAEYRQLLTLAARLPVLAARVGEEWHRPTHANSLPADAVPRLARKVHEAYVATQSRLHNATNSENAERSWDALSEVDQRSNIAQVVDIPVKLAMAGLSWRRASNPVPYAFSDQVVRTLAREEHRRWHHFQLRNGRVGHPLAVDFDALSEDAKELDHEPVRTLVELLASEGFEIVDSPDPTGASQAEQSL